MRNAFTLYHIDPSIIIKSHLFWWIG